MRAHSEAKKIIAKDNEEMSYKIKKYLEELKTAKEEND